MNCRKSGTSLRIYVIWLLAGVLAIPLASLIYSQLVAQDPPPQITPLGSAPHQPENIPSGGGGSKSSDSVDRSVREVLSQRIDVHFQETTLADVLQYLRDALNVQIVAKSAPLNETGITLDSLVTLDLKEVRASLALELVLSAANDQLTYYIRDNLVIITSKSDLTNTLTTRIYDVRALAAEGSVAAQFGGSGASGGAGSGMSMRGMMGGAMRSGPGSSPGGPGGMDSRSMMRGGMGMGGSAPQMERPVSDNPLTEIIEAVIEPQSWEVSGGPGAIRSFNGLLIVRQSDHVHAQIEDLLAEMRSAYGIQEQ